MKLICIFLAASLAVAAAKPYGVKGGYDRDNDRLVQSHIPVTEDINADRSELNQGRKTVRPARPGSGSELPVETIGGSYREREPIIQGRPIGGGHGDQGVIVGRPIGGGYGDQGVVVGRPIGRGHGDQGVIVGRPIGGGYGDQDVVVGRPIGRGYGDQGVIVGRPIGGGIGHNSHLETEELSGHGVAHRPQQIGGIKGGQQRQTGY